MYASNMLVYNTPLVYYTTHIVYNTQVYSCTTCICICICMHFTICTIVYYTQYYLHKSIYTSYYIVYSGSIILIIQHIALYSSVI